MPENTSGARIPRDKLVLITGAGSGIGRALAFEFGRAGARVIASDVDGTAADRVASELTAEGLEAHPVRLDVTRPEQIAAAREQIHATVGIPDVLVNNAGIVAGGVFTQVPYARHRATYEVNVLGVVAMTHAFLPDLISRPWGWLVNIASAAGFIGLPFGTTYASSKWAVVGLSESLRLELRELGYGHVGVTTVCPAYVDTGLFEGARPPRLTPQMTAEQLATRVVWAVRKRRPLLKTPWTVGLARALGGLLPVRAFDRFARTFGIHDSMRNWKGR